jgi:hypothetical protein
LIDPALSIATQLATQLTIQRLLAATAAALILVLNACSGAGEDVRVTLCKDMVRVQTGAGGGLHWTEAATETRGYDGAVVRLRWSGSGSGSDGNGSAVCTYSYNAVEHTAMTLSDPLSAYSASPSKMALNGTTLSKSALAETIKQAMLRQGRSLVDSVKNAVN